MLARRDVAQPTQPGRLSEPRRYADGAAGAAMMRARNWLPFPLAMASLLVLPSIADATEGSPAWFLLPLGLAGWGFARLGRITIGSRIAIELDREGLTEVTLAGRRRHHPWRQLRGMLPDAGGLAARDGDVLVGVTVPRAQELLRAVVDELSAKGLLSVVTSTGRQAAAPGEAGRLGVADARVRAGLVGLLAASAVGAWAAAPFVPGPLRAILLLAATVTLATGLRPAAWARWTITIGPATGGLQIERHGRVDRLTWCEVWGSFLDRGWRAVRTDRGDYLCQDASAAARAWSDWINACATGGPRT